jgi:Mce-associated membrane protein
MKYGATDAVDATASRYGRDRVTAIVLGVLAVALAAVVGVYGYGQWWKPRDLAQERAAAAQAARQTGVNLVSMDYREIQKGIDRVLTGMTGDIKNQWATQAKIIADTATKTQTISQVQQVRAAVLSMDGDSAEVMVAINATTTNPQVKQGSPRYYRFEMSMTKDGDRWLVSKMGMVP